MESSIKLLMFVLSPIAYLCITTAVRMEIKISKLLYMDKKYHIKQNMNESIKKKSIPWSILKDFLFKITQDLAQTIPWRFSHRFEHNYHFENRKTKLENVINKKVDRVLSLHFHVEDGEKGE